MQNYQQYGIIEEFPSAVAATAQILWAQILWLALLAVVGLS